MQLRNKSKKYQRDLSCDDIVGEAACVGDDKVTLIPRRVVANVIRNETTNVLKLTLPQTKLQQHPLPTRWHIKHNALSLNVAVWWCNSCLQGAQ